MKSSNIVKSVSAVTASSFILCAVATICSKLGVGIVVTASVCSGKSVCFCEDLLGGGPP